MKRFTLVPALLFASAVVTAAVATGAVATGAVATGAVATGAVATGAPLPPLAPDELASRADTIITGTVVESRILFHGILGASMHYVRLKVKVENIEKGATKSAEPSLSKYGAGTMPEAKPTAQPAIRISLPTEHASTRF